jgi:hypothetical protein
MLSSSRRLLALTRRLALTRGMATVMVPMPQVSESITSGAIFELPIATGQKVEENEVVAVVETEKVCF